MEPGTDTDSLSDDDEMENGGANGRTFATHRSRRIAWYSQQFLRL